MMLLDIIPRILNIEKLHSVPCQVHKCHHKSVGIVTHVFEDSYESIRLCEYHTYVELMHGENNYIYTVFTESKNNYLSRLPAFLTEG